MDEDNPFAPIELPMIPAGAGHVTSSSADFPIPGTWHIEVRARYGDFELVTFEGDVLIR